MEREAMGKCDVFRTIDEGLRQGDLGRVGAYHKFVGEGLERMWVQSVISTLRCFKIRVVDVGVAPDWKRQHDGAVPKASEEAWIMRWHEIAQRFSVIGYKGAQINQSAEAIGHTVSDTCDDNPSIAMA